MATLKLSALMGGLGLLIMCGPTSAANTTSQISMPHPANMQQSLHGLELAHNTGYGHYHGNQDTYNSGGRLHSYEYCSRNVFEPCRQSGGSYRYCNRQHHLCTYGHLNNCIRGSTC